MKNINCYYVNAVMMDYNWLATPFVLNYGYNPQDYGYTNRDENGNLVGYEGYWIEWDYENQCYQNIFGTEKVEYEKHILKCRKPRTWKTSFCCGDMAYAKYGSPNKQYNTIQLLFTEDGYLKMGALWVSYYNDIKPKVEDYSLIGRVKFKSEHISKLKEKGVIFPKLITYDCMLFKYTMNLYEDELHLRFDESFFNSDLQYTGKTRFDSGSKYEFSVLPLAIKMDDKSVQNCISTMERLHRLSMWE